MTERDPAARSTELTGRRILVAEDEYLIADEMVTVLSQAGFEALGPAASVAKALAMVAANEGRLDAALLDVSMRGEAVWPVVDALLLQSVPVVLSTGYDAGSVPPAYAHLPLCQKPASEHDLLSLLTRALDSATPSRAFGGAP